MNVGDVDLNLLRVCDAVLRSRGVTPAAATLGLTQPAVSNALARLRALFGAALFVRTAGGMDPTPFARALPGPGPPAPPPRRARPAPRASPRARPASAPPPPGARAPPPPPAPPPGRFYMSDLG